MVEKEQKIQTKKNMDIYIDKGLREVSSSAAGRRVKGDKCSPDFSPENCIGNWTGVEMERIRDFSHSSEYMNDFVKTEIEALGKGVKFLDIREPDAEAAQEAALKAAQEDAETGDNIYLKALFRNVARILKKNEVSDKSYIVVSTHQYRLKDFFHFDKTKFDMGNKKKIGFKNCSCIEMKLDRDGRAESLKVMWTPEEKGNLKYYYVSKQLGNLIPFLKTPVPEDPAMKSKTIIFIRHGEAHHNLESVSEKGPSAKLVNSPLTTKGINQAIQLRKEVKTLYTNNLANALFLSSPLDRAVQTLLAAFGPNGTLRSVNGIFAEMNQTKPKTKAEMGYFEKLQCYLRQTLKGKKRKRSKGTRQQMQGGTRRMGTRRMGTRRMGTSRMGTKRMGTRRMGTRRMGTRRR